MRTSILGIHDWWDTDTVEKNAVDICKVTHRDPRYKNRSIQSNCNGSNTFEIMKSCSR